jgi:hypothetical protein
VPHVWIFRHGRPRIPARRPPFPSSIEGSCQPAPSAAVTSTWATYNTNNQITGTNQAPAGPLYDPSGAGYVLNDGVNQYLYDAEGQAARSLIP